MDENSFLRPILTFFNKYVESMRLLVALYTLLIIIAQPNMRVYRTFN